LEGFTGVIIRLRAIHRKAAKIAKNYVEECRMVSSYQTRSQARRVACKNAETRFLPENGFLDGVEE